MNCQDDEGNSLLHHAVLHSSYLFVLNLLERGVQKNISNNRGKTALDTVHEWDHEMRKLLEKDSL